VLDVGHNFHEGRLEGGVGLFESRHGRLHVHGRALAAFLFVFDVTGRFGALQLAFRARAGRRFGARPRARGLLAQRRTVRLRGNARRVALSRSANSFTLRARFLLAHVFRATNRALGLLAVDSAFGAGGLLALHFTLRSCTNGVADGRARGVIALPATLRVTIFFPLRGVDLDFRFRFGFGFSAVSDGSAGNQSQKDDGSGFLWRRSKKQTLDLSS